MKRERGRSLRDREEFIESGPQSPHVQVRNQSARFVEMPESQCHGLLGEPTLLWELLAGRGNSCNRE